MNKKNRMIVSISVVFILAIIVLASTGNLPFLATTGLSSGSYVQVPTIMYYECSPASAPSDSNFVNMPSGNSGWVRCPQNSDSCDIHIQQTEQLSWYSQQRRIVYQICSDITGCQSQVFKTADGFALSEGYPTVSIYNLKKTDRVYINYQYRTIGFNTWADTSGARYYSSYKPFILWKNPSLGGRYEYTSEEQGCVFPSSANLLDSVKNLININVPPQSSTNDYSLEPYKTRNFIDVFIPMSVENVNFVNYNGQQGYCLNRQVFAIGQVTTNSGNYRIVDTNFNTRLASSVTCCPNEKEPNRICNDNFQWVNIEEAECSFFKPCAGADWMPSSVPKTVERYNCIDGRCVKETETRECVRDSDCIGNPAGVKCDTYLYECVNVAPPVVVTPPEPAKCAWYDIHCLIGKILGVVKWILLIIATIVAFLLGRNLSEKYIVKRKSDRYFAYILGGLLAIGVGLVAYLVLMTWVFWAICGGVVLFFVAKRFIPFLR